LEFKLTKHAEEVIKRRAIPMEWIERVLSDPQIIEPDKVDSQLQHRLRRIEEFNNRTLRVILNTGVEPVRIVTVYWNRKMRKRL
jgi:uncharacterized DUF497 family protein